MMITRRSIAVLLAGVAATLAIAIVGQARAQILPSPTIPPLPTPPQVLATPHSQNSVCIPEQNTSCPLPQTPTPPPACCNQIPISPAGFVPIGADPVTLAGGGVVLSAPLNPLSEPINSAQAVSLLQSCDEWAYEHLANGGLTHLVMPFVNNIDGSMLNTDAWAFSVFPGTEWGSQKGGTLWSLWFINANTGECNGVNYSADTDTQGTSVGGIQVPQKPNPGDLEPS